MRGGPVLILGLLVIGFVIWAVIAGLSSLVNEVSKTITENRQRRFEKKKRIALEKEKMEAERRQRQAEAALEKERREIEDFRAAHPVRIVGGPNLALLTKISGQLDEFIKVVKSCQPSIPTYDDRFSSVTFSNPFGFFFPRKNSTDDGPDPGPWEITPDVLAIKADRPLRPIYTGLGSAAEFPAKEPIIAFDPPRPPQLPKKMGLPSWSIKIVENQTGGEIDLRVENLKKVYAKEIEEAERLQRAADDLQEVIKQRWKEASEEQEFTDIFIANMKLKVRELQQSVAAQFQDCKKRYERQAAAELDHVGSVYGRYLSETKEGIEQHFSLGLETLALPVPPGFPWRVFCDRDERLIQINQRVPFSSDIVLKRADSKRPLAKRDIEYFLRRLVPAISLHIASNVAANDWHDHVDTIAVNCWSRYFEKTTGKVKDAFVSALKVEKKSILEMDINRADALDAFRALRGAFVYSIEDIVPIEPQIRLDKDDKRFVVGKDILDGMAQGQNLATMDWQDFEHLIRELLAKEYGREGSDVRITRASRDRGVDAVVFDPDPLHGGKYVVQAKRYNNLVDVSAVRDLYGTMLNEGAARGILVTTSKYGRDAFDFASNKQITLIDGQNLLSLLAKHGYQFKIELI